MNAQLNRYLLAISQKRHAWFAATGGAMNETGPEYEAYLAMRARRAVFSRAVALFRATNQRTYGADAPTDAMYDTPADEDEKLNIVTFLTG